MSAPEVHIGVQDTLLPSQFFDRPPPLTPEQRLMWAVLEEAYRSLQLFARVATEPKIAKRHQETTDWFLSDDEAWPYAFRPLCRGIGMNASAVRRGLRKRGLLPDGVDHGGGAGGAGSDGMGRGRAIRSET